MYWGRLLIVRGELPELSVTNLLFDVGTESEAVVSMMTTTLVIIAPVLRLVPYEDSFLWRTWGCIETLVTHFDQDNRKFPGELDVLDVVNRFGRAGNWSGSRSSLRFDEGLTI